MLKINPTQLMYEKFKKNIEAGQYSPAESLPEVQLANTYNVSRNTVKKVLLMLESDGLVCIEPNKGAKISSYSKAEVLDYLELREELEGFIMRVTVPCLTEKNIIDLREIIEQMTVLNHDLDLMGYSEKNRKFHDTIYASCPNKLAVDCLNRIKGNMRKYNSKTILVPGRKDQSLKEHIAIMNSIEARDVKSAEKNIRIHIRNVKKIFDEYYNLLF